MTQLEWLTVESMDIEAKGVARRADGKTVFIEGALPGETVRAQVHRSKSNYEMGVVTEIRCETSSRVTPGCPNFGLHTGACGGCKMQHLHVGAQVAVKQRVLEDNLWHLARVRPETVLRPIEGPAWGYRHRARLSVRHVRKKGEVLIGFHERKSRYVADMHVCPVLPPHVSDTLLPLRRLIASLDAIENCPQIELACGAPVASADGDAPVAVTALVLRHLHPLSDADIERLHAFIAEQDIACDTRHAARPPGALNVKHRVRWWLQPKGPDTARPLAADTPELAYTLPAFGLTMPFGPTDFTQVNPEINRVLVARALQLLDVRRDETVIDWFCGLGNFTLPLATRAGRVLGIEGSAALLRHAAHNLERNRAEAGVHSAMSACEFIASDLFELTAQTLVELGSAEKWLIDPPREGAFALVKALVELCPASDPPHAGWAAPRRIVYVSCNPATLARDAGLLVHEAGYACVAAGVVNMFPHTAHVESIALFERIDDRPIDERMAGHALERPGADAPHPGNS